MENQTLEEHLEIREGYDMYSIFLKECQLDLRIKFRRAELKGALYLLETRETSSRMTGPFASIAEVESEAQKRLDAACEERISKREKWLKLNERRKLLEIELEQNYKDVERRDLDEAEEDLINDCISDIHKELRKTKIEIQRLIFPDLYLNENKKAPAL